ncbi:MAG: amidohydrolase family protein, partial [Lentisphaeria bacterium]|nr:amidohydrolase family protein [Lentisphaeria bacterium]
PARYLDSMGLLRKNTLLAHAIYLNDEDIKLIKERGCVPAHIPASNMKLASGRFPMERYLRAGCSVALGTDSACSNNNLSMLEEMKLAALLAKLGTENPECCPAHTVYDMATVNGAAAFGLHAGVIAEGYLADGILIRTDVPAMIPTYHLHSNLVYAAEPSCIDSVICDGKFLMKHGVIEGEQEILAAANESAHKLVERVRK